MLIVVAPAPRRRRRLGLLFLALTVCLAPVAIALGLPAFRQRLLARFWLFRLRSADLPGRARAAAVLSGMERPAIDEYLPDIRSLCADDAILPCSDGPLARWNYHGFCDDAEQYSVRGHSFRIMGGAKGGYTVTRDVAWRDFLVRFHIQVKAGRWSFLGHMTDPRSGNFPRDRVRVPVAAGTTAYVELTAVSGTYEVRIDGRPPIAIEPEELSPWGPGGFGFSVDPGANIAVWDIEAKVIRGE
jgi:hypothetical protein